jgi:hypothetical protein
MTSCPACGSNAVRSERWLEERLAGVSAVLVTCADVRSLRATSS